MDKAWMLKHRLSSEYKAGVESFMKFALQDANDLDRMSCPCEDCGNLSSYKVDVVRMHLLSKGIDQTYHKWIWHGENTNSGNSMNGSDEAGQGEDNIYSRETIDMVHAAYENPDDLEKLSKTLDDAEKPLYPGCDKFTKLAAIVKLYNLKAKFSWSDNSFSELLGLFGQMLPSPNELPSSLYEAKKSLVALGLEYDKIHACPNDCVLYRKQYKDCTNCPTCGISRWKECKKSKERKNVPRKVAWFFSPIPRFRQMFRNKEVSKELSWHADERVNDGYMRHPADSPSWRLVDHKWPEFASESRNLRLALSADGINPHSTMTSTYSCWPVLLVTYNLPPWLCMKRKFMMLTLLISGPKQPGNDIDVYLEPLIDDLKLLWEEGIQAYDSFRDEYFLLKAVLLWTINDFPAYGNLSGCIVKGYHACPICAHKTNAKRLKHSRKMSYTSHRKWLHEHHPYRRQKKAFDGTQEMDEAPRPLSGHAVLERVSKIQCKLGKMSCNRQSKLDEDRPCWKKKSIFFELPYWQHLHVRHVLDVMHIEKNVCESLIGTLLDIPGKTKDGVAARLDLLEMNIRSELAPKIGEHKTLLPAACYTLTKEEKKKVCDSLMGMKVPTGYSSNVKNWVSMKDLRLVGLKSHDYHTLMQQLLPVAIRGVLPDNVRYAISRLCFFFNVLCGKVIDVDKLDEMQSNIATTLCDLEKIFPPSFFDIMVHLTIHLVREVRMCGPVWYRWMYPFERFMRVLKSYVRNRNRPEGCIAECYIAEEAVEFCADYLSSVHTIGIPSNQCKKNLTKAIGAAQVHNAIHEEWLQAHRHVLANEDEVDPYISEHMAHLKANFGRKHKSEKTLVDEHNKMFITWLRNRVSNERNHSPNTISERLKWIGNGPSSQVLKYSAYMINGVTFHTRKVDEARTTQNSGVSLVAKTMQVASARDKNPIVTDMVFYGVIDEIWELDYNKFHIPVFKCNWVESKSGIRVDELGFTLVKLGKEGHKDDQFILATQAKQVFYIEDPLDPAWSVVLATPSREYFEYNDGDEVDECLIHHQSFTRWMPSKVVADDETDENESCTRKDFEGNWVDNL